MFEVIPAIDLIGGRVVRLRQGDYDQKTVFDADPVALAADFAARGARRLHVVDLDGAKAGAPMQQALVVAMAEAARIPVQVGGGIRSVAHARAYLERGVSWVILGTVALQQPDLVRQAAAQHPGRVLVGLDARDGRVAVSGWLEQSEVTALDIGRAFADAGVAGLIYTDIARDGMGTGADVAGTLALARGCGLPVFASGGVATAADITELARHAAGGLSGVVVGRAILSGALSLEAALAAGR
jgi:phosphoribosylformimino-5-aminoimidazole carboxamide ribotide isomerase